jgi:hypothetical protein
MRKRARQWQPQQVAIETVFMDKSRLSALKLGPCARRGAGDGGPPKLPVHEYAPRVIKQSRSVGCRRQDPGQHMVRLLLNCGQETAGRRRRRACRGLTHAHMSATAAAAWPDHGSGRREDANDRTPKGIAGAQAAAVAVVDVNGVGYELEAPMSTFYDLPEMGREVSLFTHYAQKEDSVSLYGFLREGERRLFRDVQRVSGIGAKIALAVLSGVSVDEFARLVQTGDVTALTRIPGIGKKTAERMVVELRDRAADLAAWARR